MRAFFLVLLFTQISNFVQAQIKQSEPAVKSPKEASIGSCLADLENSKEYQKASNLLINLKDKKIPNEIINFRLAKLARKLNQRDNWRKYIINIGACDLTKNTKLMTELYQEAPSADKKWLSEKLLSWGFLETPKSSSCPYFELQKRKNRAELLFSMLEYLPKEKIWSELYLIYSEVIDDKLYNNNPNFVSWQKKLGTKDFVNRMNNLMLFGKNTEARETYQEALKLLPNINSHDKCELDYQNAKVERKLRRYKEAREKFKLLIKTCHPDVSQKARYMDLTLASMAADLASAPEFDHFVADYPTHGFSDDVLIFKASMFVDKDMNKEAMESLDKLIKLFPDGDMIERALFMKVLIHARLKQTTQALATLKILEEKTKPGQLEYAQSQYWTARLMLFPDLNNIKIANNKNKNKAVIILKNLIKLDSNIYSWLAVELLRKINIKPALAPKKLETQEKNIARSNQKIKFINLLIEHEFNHEALALLDEEVLQNNQQDLGAIAQSYINLKRPELGYQKLVTCNNNINNEFKKHWPQLYNQIAWPRPFKAEINHACQHIDIPDYVILGIIRRESGFIPEARSWAQALGLMQLVNSTAQEQAARLGLKEPKMTDLFQPQLNLLLGSSALFRYWQRFGHLAVALSAYNAGPTAASRWLKESKSGPIDTYIEKISYKETREYVKEVLGSAFAYAVNNKSHIPSLPLEIN